MKPQQSKILNISNKLSQATMLATTAILMSSVPKTVMAQDSKTFGDALAVPVFEQVDPNGVDLINGYLRIQSPTIVTGTEQARRVTGLQWTGRGWTHLDMPSLWKKDGVYTVNYNGRSEEFKNYKKNYAQKKPISGSTLGCRVEQPSNITSTCTYRGREGDVLVFVGIPNPFITRPDNIGETGYKLGNLAMFGVQQHSDDRGDRYYGLQYGGVYWPIDDTYYKREVTLHATYYSNVDPIARTLKIVTPNHNNDKDEHYLRPKNTTQTITDFTGSVWRYTVNSDREITRIQSPGGAADVNYDYNSKHRVVSVTTADGTWTYSYATPGDFRTVTRTDPDGKQIYVKSHRDKGHVVESRNELGRTTYYTYDDGYRLERITYPEGNRLEFSYDPRGNILTKRQIGKSGQVFTERAIYPTSCEVSPTCNKPIAIIDANGNRTDFEYAPPRTRNILNYFHSGQQTAKAGSSSPTKIILPAPGPGLIRPEVRNVYANESGVLIESSLCKTGSSCAGTSDEVKTMYDYRGTEQTSRRLYSMRVVSNGENLLTCYGYDATGRRISETPPRANLTTCPGVAATYPGATLIPSPNPRVTPTYPGVVGGGTSPGGGGSGGGSGGPPNEEDCGTGGQVCN